MSKRAKKAAQERRASMKRAKKDAMNKQYATWRDAGQNGRSKRSKLASKRSIKGRTQRHVEGKCGNHHGCHRCAPSELWNPWQASPGSCLFSKRFTSKKWRRKED